MLLLRRRIGLFLLVLGIVAAPAFGQEAPTAAAPPGGAIAAQPSGSQPVLTPLESIPVVQTSPIDREAVRLEDEAGEEQGQPPRFAIPNEVFITPYNAGVWEWFDEATLLWRLRITCPEALSVNLGFTKYSMPTGAALFVYAADGSYAIGPYTENDNADSGELWTAVVLGSDVVVELTIPETAVDQLQLELTSINHGYRFFGEKDDGGPRHGACNINVICPNGDPWRNEIPAIGVYTLNGSWTCSGVMVNNTLQNQTPYFLTANHCGITSGNASTVVVYWNHQTPTCAQHGGGSLSQNQSGSTFRASSSTSDFCLVQLNASPTPAWGITFAGWDRNGLNPPSGACIHHPSTDVKSITRYDVANRPDRPSHGSSWPCSAYPGPGNNTHIKVYWHLEGAVTEPGSSGSPLFDNNRRVIGQLHGGASYCGATGDSLSDCYGRFSRSWTGGGTNATRLSNWLDPTGTGATSLNTFNPYADATAPTPNPMTFASAPAPTSTSAVSMTATTAADATTPPVSYFFTFVSGGSGGDSSAWQSGTGYTDSGLAANTAYTYNVRARDSAATPNVTSPSGNAATATLIQTPTGVSFGTVTNNSIALNAAGTLTNLTVGTSGVYFDSTTVGGDGGINEWVQVATDTATGLSPNTSYTFRVKARNQNSVETAYSPTAAKVSLANVPAAPTLGSPTTTTMTLDVNAGGKPAVTVFAIQCTGANPNDANWVGQYVSAAGTATASAVWQADATWGVITVTGLQSATTYTFAVKARNQEGVETTFGPGASLATAGEAQTGACCYDYAPCAVVTQTACTTGGGGVYKGNGTACTTHLCCLGLMGDMNADAAVDGADIQSFADAMLAGFHPCADLAEPYDTLDEADVTAFVNLLLGS